MVVLDDRNPVTMATTYVNLLGTTCTVKSTEPFRTVINIHCSKATKKVSIIMQI